MIETSIQSPRPCSTAARVATAAVLPAKQRLRRGAIEIGSRSG